MICTAQIMPVPALSVSFSVKRALALPSIYSEAEDFAAGYATAAADFPIESFIASDETGTVIDGMTSGLTAAFE